MSTIERIFNVIICSIPASFIVSAAIQQLNVPPEYISLIYLLSGFGVANLIDHWFKANFPPKS